MTSKPIVVLPLFNKPDLLELVLEKISLQTVLPEQIEIYIDRPKSLHFSNENKGIIEYCNKLKLENIQININIREKNYGCEGNILGAIQEVLEKHETMVLIEDDVLVNPYFYQSICLMLEKYQNQSKILTVRGYCSDLRAPQDSSDIQLSDYFLCAGMATWRSKWLPFYESVLKNKIISLNYMHHINKTNYHVIKGHYTYNSGASDDWGNLLGAHCLKSKLFHIEPKKSLIFNIGCGHPGANLACIEFDELNINFSEDFKISSCPANLDYTNYKKIHQFKLGIKFKKLTYIYLKNIFCFLLANFLGIQNTRKFIRFLREKRFI